MKNRAVLAFITFTLFFKVEKAKIEIRVAFRGGGMERGVSEASSLFG